MRKFNIKVNGNIYEVEVEEVGSSVAQEAVYSVPEKNEAAVTPAPQAAVQPKAATVNAGTSSIKAPMPGTINAVKVTAGEQIKKGQVIAVLEAMKMENDISAPEDAVVASVAVTQGQSVNTGDVIITLK